MTNWNEGYTYRKQKEMALKQIRVDKKAKKAKKAKMRPLYPYDPYEGVHQTTLHERRMQTEKDRQMWIIGGVIIGLVTIAGISAIAWALIMS